MSVNFGNYAGETDHSWYFYVPEDRQGNITLELRAQGGGEAQLTGTVWDSEDAIVATIDHTSSWGETTTYSFGNGTYGLWKLSLIPLGGNQGFSLYGGGIAPFVSHDPEFLLIPASPIDTEFSVITLEGISGVTEFAFTDQTSGGNTPHSYKWDFGDSEMSVLQNPTHVYASAGIYTVALTVTDGLASTNTEIKESYVTVFDAGDANGDGNINGLDISKVVRMIMMLDAETLSADANLDGNINALDITRIEQVIYGS